MMKSIRSFVVAAVLLLGSSAAHATLGNPPTVKQFVPFVDSQGFIVDSGGDARTFGAAMLNLDGHLWIEVKRTAGTRIGHVDWVDVGFVRIFDWDCTWTNQIEARLFESIMPYKDGADLHACSRSSSCINWSGTYRALGDGGLPANQGGGDRNGIMLRDSFGNLYVLVIKTASGRSGSGGCVFTVDFSPNNDNGPGNIGEWILLHVHTND